MSTDLVSLVRKQHSLQVDSFDLDPVELQGAELMEFIRWNVLAMTDELHEALQETGWKPWSTSNHIDRERFMKELVDAFHFFMNLMLAGAGNADIKGMVTKFTAEYEAKHKVNAKRQEEGYDGIKNKCTECKRELLDPDLEILGQYGDRFCSISCMREYDLV